MQVGDLVRYTGKNRIGMKTGTIGYVESISSNVDGVHSIFIVKILSTGKTRRFLERDLNVVENQTESR